MRRADLRVDFFRSTGSGGQNVNKVSSACRITHLPTGIATESRAHRDQPANRKAAFEKLAALLEPLMRAAISEANGSAAAAKTSKSDEHVRSYDLTARRVKDHRLSGSADEPAPTWNPERVLDGNDLAEIHHFVLLSEPE